MLVSGVQPFSAAKAPASVILCSQKLLINWEKMENWAQKHRCEHTQIPNTTLKEQKENYYTSVDLPRKREALISKTLSASPASVNTNHAVTEPDTVPVSSASYSVH